MLLSPFMSHGFGQSFRIPQDLTDSDTGIIYCRAAGPNQIPSQESKYVRLGFRLSSPQQARPSIIPELKQDHTQR